LQKSWGLGPSRTDAVLLRGLTNEPPSRLGSEADAKKWLDETANMYAKEKGITLDASSATSSAVSAMQVINSEEFDNFKRNHEEIVNQQIELFMRHLGKSSRVGHNMYMDEKARSTQLQEQLDKIYQEHGEKYIKGISQSFNSLKVRKFDSSWNWVRQDSFEMWFDIIFGRLTTVDREITAKCIALINRADPGMIRYIRYHIESCITARGDTYKLAKEFAQLLLENCETALTLPPKHKDVAYQTAPCTIVTKEGEIQYKEIPRPDAKKLESYVKEMAAGSKVAFKINLEKVHAEVGKLYEMVKQLPQTSMANKDAITALYDEVVKSLNVGVNTNVGNAADRPPRRLSSSFVSPPVDQPVLVPDNSLPFLNLKRNLTGTWMYSKQLTCVYLDILTEIATSGSSFENTNALLTGCGKGSIGVEAIASDIKGKQGRHCCIV